MSAKAKLTPDLVLAARAMGGRSLRQRAPPAHRAQRRDRLRPGGQDARAGPGDRAPVPDPTAATSREV
jgi:hypothetical protein